MTHLYPPAHRQCTRILPPYAAYTLLLAVIGCTVPKTKDSDVSVSMEPPGGAGAAGAGANRSPSSAAQRSVPAASTGAGAAGGAAAAPDEADSGAPAKREGSGHEPNAALPPSDPHSIAAALANAVCDALLDCIGPSALATITNREDCNTHFTASLEQSDFGELDRSISEGNVAIDASQLEDCYRDTRALNCKFYTDRLPPSCERAIQGKRGLGESCRLSAECAGAAFCPMTQACPHVCQATRAPEATCQSDGECQRGTICSGGICRAPAGAGAACGGTSSPNCALGLTCMDASDTMPGKCQPNAAIQVGALDAVCNPNGPLCREGLSCAYDGHSGFVCRAPVKKGEACRLALPGQCPSDSYCNATDIMAVGTCVELPKHGQACVLGDQCAPGHVCITEGSAGKCHALLNLDQDCELDGECRSGRCSEGRCAVPIACE
jgi:hypothetical protein